MASVTDEVFVFTAKFIHRRGYSPTVRNVQDAFGMSSTSVAYRHLERLVKGGSLVKRQVTEHSYVYDLPGGQDARHKASYGSG
jgi:SOS-response transcriptional repressor LexA